MTPRAAPDPREVRTIGCLMLNGVGDIVCVTPAVEALKARYPDARLSIMIRPHLRDLVERNPAVDEVIAFGQGSIGRRLSFLREMRRRRFDLWVDLHTPTFNTMTSNRRNFVRNALLMRLSGSKYRRAYAVPELARHLTHPLAVPEAARLRADNVVDLTLALAWPEPGRPHALSFTLLPAERTWAEGELPGSGPRVALYLGTRQPSKAWPLAHCVRFVEMVLAQMPEVELVVIGDRTDAALAGTLRAALDPARAGRMRDLTGRATFGQTAALLERCRAIVSTDSGPMHIADAMDLPIVALFSTHNYPTIWSPVNGKSIVVYHEIECGPCFLAECPVGNRCMANITPEEAFAALAQLLGAGAVGTMRLRT
jgi:ADP-heptose:LPS heptosyltransferase